MSDITMGEYVTALERDLASLRARLEAAERERYAACRLADDNAQIVRAATDERDAYAQRAIAAEKRAAEARAERFREALLEWATALDESRRADRLAARARVKAYSGLPAMPKRMPRSAVLMSSLPPDEQRRINEECARFMAPINAAEADAAAARKRLVEAEASARATLDEDAPAPSQRGEETPT